MIGLSPSQMRRFRRDASAMFGLTIMLLLIAFAIVGPWLAADPLASHFDLPRSASGGPPGPSWQHPLGTDVLYRDVLARLAHGARLSLGVAAVATAIAMGIGTAVGVIAGWLEGTRLARVDALLMRAVDVVLAFPYLLFITAIGVAVDRADASTVILVLGLTGWCGMARLIRHKTLQHKQQPFIVAARALGSSDTRTIYKHLIPALAPTLLVLGSHALASMILAEAVLSYLTVGIEPPHATWGRMLHEAESYVGSEPLLVAAPGMMILLSALALARIADGLRDALEPHASTARGARARYAADVLVIAAAALLVGFASHDQVAAPIAAAHNTTPMRGGTLRVASSGDINTLEPALAYDEASRALNDLVFATLLTWDPDGTLVGDLATSFALTDGGRRVTLRLRPGARMHDGSTLTAADVKRSLERTLHPSTPCPAAHLYKHVVGYQAFKDGSADELAGVVVDDALSLHIDLDEADASFLSLLGLGFAAPVCPSSGATVDTRAPAPPCGAGPFRVARFDHGERVVLERFADYHREGEPYLDGVTWELSVPPQTQRYRFERGELDVITELPGIDVYRYANDERWRDHRVWIARPLNHFVFMNTQMAPFDNRHLRRAVAAALDPEPLALVRASVGPTQRVLPPSVPGPAQEPAMRRHDVDAALREMELAGYAYDPLTDAGGYPDPIDYITIPDTFAQASAEVFQQQLARVGIRIRLELVAWATWLVMISEPQKVQMGWRGWGADYPDPSTFFEPILTTSAIQEAGTQNVSFFSHAEFDDVVARARREPQWSRRMELYQRAEEIVRDEAPLVPMYGARALALFQPRVRGYVAHAVLPERYRDVWLDRGAP